MLSCCWPPVYEGTSQHLDIQRHTCHLHPIFIKNSQPIISTKNKNAQQTPPKKRTHPVKVELLFSHRNSLVVCTKEQAPEQEELLASLDRCFNGGNGRWTFGRGLLFPPKTEWNKESGWFFFNLFCNFHPEIWGRFQILTDIFHIRLKPPTRNVKIPQATCAGPLLWRGTLGGLSSLLWTPFQHCCLPSLSRMLWKRMVAALQSLKVTGEAGNSSETDWQ